MRFSFFLFTALVLIPAWGLLPLSGAGGPSMAVTSDTDSTVKTGHRRAFAAAPGAMRPLRRYPKDAPLKAWRRYDRKRKSHKLYVKLKNYRFSLGKWVTIHGEVTGNISLHLKDLHFTDYRSLLPRLQQAEGTLHFTSLSIPFYGDIKDIHLSLYPSTKGVTQFHGSLASNLRLSGNIAHGKLQGEAVFLGVDLSRRLPHPWSSLVSAKANGTVNFSLAPRLRSSISLDGLLAVLSRRGRKGEHLILRNDGPVMLNYFGGKITMQRGRFSLGGSRLTVKGFATKREVAFTFNGTGDISTLSPWIPGPVSRFHGPFVLDAALQGTLRNPRVTGALSMIGGGIRHEKGKQLFTIESLAVVADPGRITMRGLFRDMTRRRLNLKGSISLQSYYPQNIDMVISGSLPGEILQDLSDIHFSEAKGRGDINVRIAGDFFSPLITGTFLPVDIALRPRGVYKDIEISGGRVDFRNGNLYLRGIKATYDDSVIGVEGFMILEKNFYCNLQLKGANIPFRKRDQYHGEVSPTVRLRGRRNKLSLTGKLDVITGRYTRQFDIIKEIITIHRFREGTDPLWKHYPWIGNISLELALHNSGDFEVENNIGELSLDGLLALRGTLASPKLKGSVNVNYGNFKIPFLKGQYEVNRGTVDFDKTSEPFLRLEGTTTVENTLGEEVIVTLNLLGPLSKITFSIKSFPELEQGQILMLLASGRTTAELRRMYHGDPRSGTTTASTSYNPVQLYDEPIKQITGDFFSQLVASPIKMVTKLDLIRFELGSDSFQLKLSKKFIKRIKFTGEFEMGFMGQNRQEGGLEVKFHDRLMLDSKLRRYEPGINEYIYETPFKGKVELKYRLPLRGSLRDILGL